MQMREGVRKKYQPSLRFPLELSSMAYISSRLKPPNDGEHSIHSRVELLVSSGAKIDAVTRDTSGASVHDRDSDAFRLVISLADLDLLAARVIVSLVRVRQRGKRRVVRVVLAARAWVAVLVEVGRASALGERDVDAAARARGSLLGRSGG